MKFKTLDTTAGIPRKTRHDLQKKGERTLVIEIKRVEQRTPSQDLAWKEIWKTLLNDNGMRKNSNN